jgi:CRP/FNR family transcriptional regulator, anaerobic regulatory protein
MIKKTAISPCLTCEHRYCAAKVPIFNSLDADQLNVLSLHIRHKTYARDENMLTEGTVFENLIFINKGQAKAYKHSLDGKETIFYIFTKGDFFGEKNLFSSQTASYSVKAMEKTDVCMIHKKDFQTVILSYPHIALKILNALSHRIDTLEKTIDRGGLDVEKRIHQVLLEFSKKYGQSHANGRLVTLPINREGIANYIGVSRETVSRKMIRLQNDGAIRMVGNKKVLILNETLLKAQAH